MSPVKKMLAMSIVKKLILYKKLEKLKLILLKLMFKKWKSNHFTLFKCILNKQPYQRYVFNGFYKTFITNYNNCITAQNHFAKITRKKVFYAWKDNTIGLYTDQFKGPIDFFSHLRDPETRHHFKKPIYYECF
tara:strand:- start:81 stop:479 length:399 start_codon:yes stop_codon:yes gene_type:complete